MKNILIIGVCVIVTLASVSYSISLLKRINEKDAEKSSVKKAIQVEADIISRKIDKQGFERVTIEAAKNVMPISEVKNSAAIGVGILDTTAMAIGILKKQVKDLLVINTTLKAENLQAKEVSRNGNRYLSYSDKTLGLSYRPPVTSDTTDKGTLSLDYYNSELSITQYWKRKWFLGAKKGYIDISTNDIRNTVNGVKQLTVEQKTEKVGIQLQGSVFYNPINSNLGFGPSLRVDVGRLNLQGNYNWFPDEKKWMPGINLNYDLIKF